MASSLYLVSKGLRRVYGCQDLPSERTDVRAAVESGLQREDDPHHLFAGGSNDDFTSSHGLHLILRHLCFSDAARTIVDIRRPTTRRLFAAFLHITTSREYRLLRLLWWRRSIGRGVDVRMQERLCRLMTLTPLAGWRVDTQEEHACSRDADEDEWHDECHTPGLGRCQALVNFERVVDDGH